MIARQNDETEIDRITEGYAKLILMNNFTDAGSFLKLSIRLSNINDNELAKFIRRENDQVLMMGRGASAN